MGVRVRESVATPPTPHKSRAISMLVTFWVRQSLSADRLEFNLTMTIQTETEQPALTYSKSKGLVTLVTGTEL